MVQRMETPKRAIGIIELRSIARGMYTTDVMLKQAKVELLRAHVVCPGKYVILIAGAISQVQSAIEAGKKVAPEVVVDSWVCGRHRDLFPGRFYHRRRCGREGCPGRVD
jgi:microcompartment protein CcmL/EutN